MARTSGQIATSPGQSPASKNRHWKQSNWTKTRNSLDNLGREKPRNCETLTPSIPFNCVIFWRRYVIANRAAKPDITLGENRAVGYCKARGYMRLGFSNISFRFVS